MRLEGEYFEGKSSRSHAASISIDHGRASIFQEEGCIGENLSIASIRNGRNVHLENGGLFVLKEKLTGRQLDALETAFQRTLRRLETFSFRKAALLSVFLLVLLFGFRFLLYSLSSTIAAAVPVEWERGIGAHAYESLLSGVLEPSELTEAQQERIALRARVIIAAGEYPVIPELRFHDSDIGANALAFPGGPIVVTDDLVELLQSDEQVLSVIAHEVAHIQERHALEQIIEVIGVAAVASVWFGADDSLVEEASAIAVNLWSFRKSRDLEKEADLAAMDIMERAGLQRTHFIEAIELLTEDACGRGREAGPEVCLKGLEAGWLSTHPSGAERIEYLKRGQE